MRIIAFLIALVGLVEAEEELVEVLFDKNSSKEEDDPLSIYLHCPTKHQIQVAHSEFLLFHWNFPRVSDVHSAEFAAHLKDELSHCAHSFLRSCSKFKKSSLRPRRSRLVLSQI